MNCNSLIIAIGTILFSFFIAPCMVSAASNTVLDFDGTSDYIAVADSAILDQANSLSLSVWIEPDDTPAGDEYILYRYNNYYLKINSSRQIVGSVNTDSARVTSVRTITADGAAWTHIEMTYDKDAGGTNEIKLYINGVLDAVGDYSTAITASTKKLYFGAGDTAGDNTPENWYDGQIDNPKLYSYARSVSDILLDYNNGLAVFLGPSGKTCAQDPASCMDYGLVGNWAMDEGSGQNAYDMSDSKNNGTLGTTPSVDVSDPKWSKGKNGGGLGFDGVNDYVNAGSGTSLKPDYVTLTAWIKTATAGVVNGMLVAKSTAPYTYDLYVDWNGKARMEVDGVNLAVSSVSGLTSVNNGNWHFIAGNYDGSEIKIYVDGILDKTPYSYIGGVLENSDEHLAIGTRLTDPRPFSGSIDEVRIYNRALSAEEVRYHYNHGGPVAEWKFDEGSGTKVFDSTENNNNGTLVGATHLPTWTAGKYGSALTFDGTEDYVNAGNGASLNIAQITIEAWVKLNSLNHQYITGKTDATTTEKGYGTALDQAGKFELVLFGGSNPTGIRSVSGGTVATSGVWYHVVGVADGTNMYLYLNGKLDRSAVGTMGSPIGASPFLIGKILAGYNLNGTIDEVRIYNYARTPSQILTDYNGGVAAHLK